MKDDHPAARSRLVVTGLVEAPARHDLDQLRSLADRDGHDGESVVPLRRVIDRAVLAEDATHVSAVSADGAYTASIPLPEAMAKGEIRLGGPSSPEQPIRLTVPGGMTRCWNVKGLGLLRVTEGPEPDSLPAVLTH